MEVLANISLEWFRILAWTLAIVFGGLVFVISAHKKYWEIIAATMMGLLAASFVFLLSNLAIAFYILANITSPRWSVGKDPLMSPTEIQSPLGWIDEIVKVLNDTQQNVSGAVNTVGYMKDALYVAAEFFWMTVLAVAAVFVCAILTFAAVWFSKRLGKKYSQKVAEAEKRAVARKLEEQDRNLAEIREHIGMEAFQKPVN